MVSQKLSWFLTPILFALVLPNLLSGQANLPAGSNKELVTMTVTVRSRAGEYATGLNRDAFQITDDKETRAVEFFDSSNAPLSIGILVDTSGSMGHGDLNAAGRADQIGEGLARFLELANGKNQYFLLAFDRTPHLLTDWTTADNLLSRKTSIEEPHHNTAMYDACFAGIEKLDGGSHAKRALILISDGYDNLSRHSLGDLRRLLRSRDVLLYAIAPKHGDDIGSTVDVDGLSVLEELAEITGGVAFVVENGKQLRGVLELIAAELRQQYRLGFLADNASAEKKWHRLKVTVDPTKTGTVSTKISIRTRQGYYTR
ncbi:MAG: VWA domain-containing protein [Acidobacteriota bacterium]